MRGTSMTFVSVEFLLLFVFVVSLYFVLPYRWRLAFLMATSLYFYMYWNAIYVVLIVWSTLVDYTAAIRLEAAERQRQRRIWLAMSIVTNLATLFTFKYFNFFADSLHAALTGFGIDIPPVTLNVLLPVGISFYTFQSMAYTIDVYRGELPAERNFIRFFTFVAFFPQLVAGPIERATHLLPQFALSHRFDVGRITEGLRFILWGLFKKMVIADRLAIYVNTVYGDATTYQGLPLITATVFFAFQIYCDFSGYSDIAVGTARILGFNLMVNFRQPYLAASLREFWRRWHISLSTWFRDYVYIPLGGNRVRFAAMLRNLLIVFVVSGLWHGARWTFVIWGFIHGLGVVVETVLGRTALARQIHLPRWVRWAVTTTVVMVAWVFFRADSLETALAVLRGMTDFSLGWSRLFAPFDGAVLGAQTEFMVSIALIVMLMVWDWFDNRTGQFNTVFHIRPWALRWVGYYGLGLGILVSLAYGLSTQDFIYFQF